MIKCRDFLYLMVSHSSLYDNNTTQNMPSIALCLLETLYGIFLYSVNTLVTLPCANHPEPLDVCLDFRFLYSVNMLA